jgi:protein arginine kinase activator
MSMDTEACDKCGKPATILLTDVVDGKLTERKLCQACAAEEGVVVKTNMSLSELLEDFVLHTSGAPVSPELACDVCGLTFAEFRKQKVLGCPHDYDAFEPALRPLIESAHGGASQHVGKAPHRSGGQQKKQNALLRLRADLKKAVAAEDYERAAMLRDQIQELEAS